MPDCVIVMGPDGKLAGVDEKSRRAYQKFKRVVTELVPGATMKFSYRLPRSQKHHAYFFGRLQALFERQESFTDLEHLLTFLKVGAGFVEFLPSPKGLVAVPKSIAWDQLDEKEFTEVHQAIRQFLWTAEAQLALWPALHVVDRHELVERWVREGGP